MAEYIEREDALTKLEDIGFCDDEPIQTRNRALKIIKNIPAADVRPVVQRESLMQALSKFFSIGDSYTYELNRVKEAFYIGTMSLDDFEEWNEDNVSELCDYLMKELFCPNCGAVMREDLQ